MYPQDDTRQAQPASTPAKGRSASWIAIALAVSAGAGLALALLPAMAPALVASMSGATPHVYWYISRASAFVAFGLLWIAMLAGLGITGKFARYWPGMPGSLELHRFTSLLGLGFGLVHALVLLGDQYINYSLGQVLAPFMASNYRPEWVGLGQVAFYALAVVAFSFYVKDRLGTRAWRAIHALSFALFLMVIVHGLQSGTDSQSWWAQGLYWVSGTSVLLGSIYRVLSARIGRPKQALARSGLIATPGKAQVKPPRYRGGSQGRTPAPVRQGQQISSLRPAASVGERASAWQRESLDLHRRQAPAAPQAGERSRYPRP